MRRFIPLLALFAAGIVASYALAAPSPGKHDPSTSSSTSTSEHGKGANKCHPVNLKGTVTNATIVVNVTKASGHSMIHGNANLTINGKVGAQVWMCSSPGASPTQTLFLRQLHVGGKPGTQTTTTANP
jgi:hypothetical protein